MFSPPCKTLGGGVEALFFGVGVICFFFFFFFFFFVPLTATPLEEFSEYLKLGTETSFLGLTSGELFSCLRLRTLPFP